MPDPPTLAYSPGEPKKRSTRGQKAIGLLGFLVYAVPAVAFDVTLIMGVVYGRHPPARLVVIVASIGAFCTWRAIAGFLQFLR